MTLWHEKFRNAFDRRHGNDPKGDHTHDHNGAYVQKSGDTVTGEISVDGEPWTAVTYLNGWTDFGSRYTTVQYRKTADGFVHLLGLADGGSATADTIFTLPAGYRPAADHIFSTAGQKVSGENHYLIDVRDDGSVVNSSAANPSATPSFLSLSGISIYVGV